MEKEKQKWCLRCTAAFVSQLALLAVLILTGRLVYATNDDTTMVAIACGGYGSPSQYVVFLHLILGYLLKFLFTICNGVNWVTVLFLVADMLSVLVLDMVFASAKRDKAGFLSTVIVLDVALLIVLAHFTFTVVAYWAGIAGLIGLTYVFEKNADKSHRLLIGICAGIAFTFCLMIRAETVISLVMIYASYIAVSLLFHRNWKPLIIALAVVCLMLVSKESNAWMNNLNLDQRTYMSWNKARSAAVDCPPVPYEEAAFSEKSITYNQYQAIYCQYYYNYDNVDTESMEALAELNSPQNRYDFDVMGMLENHFSLWGSTEQRQSFTSLYRILFAAVLLFYLVFGNRKDYPFLFLIWGSTVAAECVFYFIRRPLYRVVMPGYLMSVVLIVLCCTIDPQKEQKLHSMKISLKKFTVTLCILLACGSACVYSGYQVWVYSDAERAVLDYLAENDDKVYMAADLRVYGIDVADSVWNHPGNRGIWNLIGNWETYSVPYFELMERQGIQDPYNVLYEAIDNDKILLLTSKGDDYPMQFSWVLGLIEENYHIKAEFEKVEDVSRADTGDIQYTAYKLARKDMG
ncbi:MAG: hypothetical protein MR762_05275 [Clostridiales bacterium]|nr:hypothetical protein [Clostridiales bacterium]